MHYVGTRHPLARTNPLRSIALIRPAAGIIPRSDQSKAEWALNIARRDVPLLEQKFAVYCAALGQANRMRGPMRRHCRPPPSVTSTPPAPSSAPPARPWSRSRRPCWRSLLR